MKVISNDPCQLGQIETPIESGETSEESNCQELEKEAGQSNLI